MRVTAQRLADDRIEFALQQREADGAWSERMLPRGRFFPAEPNVGRWLNSTPLTVRAPGASADSDGVEVRITAQRLADSRTEFALQQREADGEWGERLLPRARFFPASTAVGRWLSSTPLTVSTPSTAGSMVQGGAADAAPTPACGSREQDALVALYNAMDGANWLRNTNWSSEEPVGNWYGVTTDSGGCVTDLELASNRLSGAMPAELGNLSMLRVLNLSENNRLSGAIPPELGNLSRLETLDLSDQTGQPDYSHALSGSIPPELGNLASLRILDLSWHRLSGEIPTALGNLTNLETLELHGNSMLSGAIPTELGNLAHLRSLRLNHNDLSGAIPAELGQLSELRQLFLSSNSLDGAIPEELGELARLEGLYLGNNDLSGPIPAALGSLSRLVTLDLRDNHLSGDVPSELANLSALHSYYLHGNSLTGCIPARFRALRSTYATYAFDDPRPDLPPFCEETGSCATGTAVPAASTNPGLVADCDALLAAVDILPGEATLNWTASTPIARWQGVTLGGSVPASGVTEVDVEDHRAILHTGVSHVKEDYGGQGKRELVGVAAQAGGRG